MPENVTGFQPTGNLKKSLIGLTRFDMLPRRTPTFFREEPFFQNHRYQNAARTAKRLRKFGYSDIGVLGKFGQEILIMRSRPGSINAKYNPAVNVDVNM